MDAPVIEARREVVLAHLALLTKRWAEIDARVHLELRAFADRRSAIHGHFGWDAAGLAEAADWALAVNRTGLNLYVMPNPVRESVSKAAEDEDIPAAFFAWADCDKPPAIEAAQAYSGPRHMATVLTGRVPSLRAHFYWELEEPVANLDSWRQLQQRIAGHLGSDPVVINPSRVMRLAGTVSRPSTKKAREGYVTELVALRTEYEDDRDPVGFEALWAAMPPRAVERPVEAPAGAPGGPRRTPDIAAAAQRIAAGEGWHVVVRGLVASYVSRGLSDDEIQALCAGLTEPGYTAADTAADVQRMITGARRKGWGGASPRARREEERQGSAGPAAAGGGEPGGEGPRAPGPDAPDDPVARAAQLPLNDFGNGQRVVVHFGSDLMFVPRVGWHVWDGRIWAQDFDQMAVRKVAHRIPDLIRREAQAASLPTEEEAAAIEAADKAAAEIAAIDAAPNVEELKPGARKARLRALERDIAAGAAARGRMEQVRMGRARHAKNAGNSGPISNMLAEAAPYVAQRIEALNADPLVLACESGVVRFREVEDAHAAAWGGPARRWEAVRQDHAREQRITKLMPVPYEPGASAPRFLEFLERILPDPDMRAFLQRWFGYGLTGLTTEQKLVFLHGVGRNGKSTLVDLIARVMGEYATSIPIESLTGSEQRKGGDATPDLVRLPGARMVRASEPEEGMRFREALVKLLTGGEPVMIRRMREEFVEVQPCFKLTISGNHKPNVRGTDDGIWRRILLVPFEEQIAKEEVDPALPAKLWAERAGVFNWLVAGALDFLNGGPVERDGKKVHQTGLREPDTVLDATEEFRDESDPTRMFLIEACEITGRAEDVVRSRDLSEAFAYWQEERGETPWGKRSIALKFREKAEVFRAVPGGPTFRPHKASDAGYSGLRLLAGFKAAFEASRERREGYA